MSGKIKQNFLILFLLIFFNTNFLFAQNYSIDYLGIVSKDLDQNMAKMTSDLYFTQLNEIPELSINDKRTEAFLEDEPEKSLLSQQNLSFYTEIKKSINSEKWLAVIHVIDSSNNEEHKKQKEYDSFYKILMESKANLKETIKSLIENKTEQKEEPVMLKEVEVMKQIQSTESLSGTWSCGDEYIEKIVILRGGRGFVIFKNGASMTIEVKMDSSSILITQKGRSNASFYPDLPRTLALNVAPEAEPMVWKLNFVNDNTLSGTKKTIVANNDSFEYTTIPVKWVKVN